MRENRLLASDLDGTLIDASGVDESALVRFRSLLNENSRLALAYVTGRSVEHALEGIEAARLPWPDYLCTSLGTELHVGRSATGTEPWQLDEEFRAGLLSRRGARPLPEADAIVLARSGVHVQPSRENHELKRSYFVRKEQTGCTDGQLQELARQLDAELDHAGFTCTVLASVDPSTGDGLLDLLPRGVTKATVVEHLKSRLNLPAEHVVFAGDSGNDVAALRGPWHGILVGNASDAVRELVLAPGRDATWPQVVRAREPVMSGVLEGLTALGWIKA